MVEATIAVHGATLVSTMKTTGSMYMSCSRPMPPHGQLKRSSSRIYAKQSNLIEFKHKGKYGHQLSSTNEMPTLPLISKVQKMLQTISDGAITISAYDTAWVARIPSPSNSEVPEFPQCLNWIIENQHMDGSWGDTHFNVYDRMLSSLSCVLALRTWKVADHFVDKGIQFISKHMDMLKEDNGDLLVGFELIFPQMIEEAKAQGLKFSGNHPFIQRLEALRAEKMQSIPLELIHTTPTTVLFSLEGLRDSIDWNKMLHLQSEDGSFLTSPSSTACTYLHTKDQKCLNYLRNLVQKHKNAVPDFYPLDMFERLWLVDTIQRLGIDRFFKQDIKEVLDYIYRYWNNKTGIGWASNVAVPELDCTSMGFRLLRLHGYDVSADVFRNFMKDGKFFCFPGERSHGISDIFSLFRASQIAYPGEGILHQAHEYAKKYLSNLDDQHMDKWALKKDLRGEVHFEINNAWCSCSPRLYAKTYIEQYGIDDLWIAKTIYRLPNVNNSTLLQIAKEDYDYCKSCLHQEISELSRWWASSGLSFTDKRVKLTDNLVNRLHFNIGGYVYEPELGTMRLVYVKIACFVILCDDLADHFLDPLEYQELAATIQRWDFPNQAKLPSDAKTFYQAIYTTLNEITEEASKICMSASNIIKSQFVKYVNSVIGEVVSREHVPALDEYLEKSRLRTGIPAIVLCPLPFCGIDIDLETLERVANCKELELTCDIVRLSNDLATYKVESDYGLTVSSITAYLKDHPEVPKHDAIKKVTQILDEKTKELIKVYTQPSKDGLPELVRRIIFETARTARFVYANGVKEAQDDLKLPSQETQDIINSVVGTSNASSTST